MRVLAEHLTMHYDDAGRIIEVFRDLNLEVDSGDSLAIVGESGVGKTTMLYILGALERPVRGRVTIGEVCYQDYQESGRDLAEFRGRHVGFVFQFHHLLPEFDARENVAMPLLIRGVPWGKAMSRADELLGRTGLSHRLSHRPGALSGGEQQRVAVARAFAGHPGVVLADEPTGNLDVRTGGEIGNLLRQLQREEGITLIVATHSLELARSLGRIVEMTSAGLVER